MGWGTLGREAEVGGLLPGGGKSSVQEGRHLTGRAIIFAHLSAGADYSDL